MPQQYTLIHAYHCYLKEKKEFLREIDIPASWIMFAIEDGSFEYRIDGVEGTAGSGDIVVCPAKLRFERKLIKPLSFHYIIFNFQDRNDPRQERVTEALRQLYRFNCSPSEKARLFNNCRHLYQLSLRDDPDGIHWKNHLLNDIWFLLMMEIEKLENQSAADRDPLMKRAKCLIEETAHEEVVMKTLAAELQLHPVQFTRRFQSVYGMSPYQYLTAVRMERAKSLLIHTDHTIDHIAQSCGYSNGFYFSRIFTKHVKMNPSEYRRIHSVSSP